MGMRNGFRSGVVLTAGLLVACAAGPHAVHDDEIARIEESMRPEPHPEIIPEGIAMGEDAPPLAPDEPEEQHQPVIVTPDGLPLFPGCFLGTGPVCGPNLGSVHYNIKATPGGSIPGLLP
jgi:hypothetical protein